MDIHIGKEIQKIYKKRRFGQSELARLINTTPQNVNALFKRKSIDTDQLLKISKALDFNFFKLYSDVHKGKFQEGLEAAMIAGELLDRDDDDPEAELIEVRKQFASLDEKYRLQTENASNQRKVIDMLEEKSKTEEQYHKSILKEKEDLIKRLQEYSASLAKKLEKYEKAS